MNGIGDSLKVLNTENVTGAISKIVVTLSMNIDTTAVNVHKASISFQRLPLVFLLIFIPKYWNIPVSDSIATMIIIPSRRPIVLKSIELTANSRLFSAVNRLVVIPIIITDAAPTNAMAVLWAISNDNTTYTESNTMAESAMARLNSSPSNVGIVKTHAETIA